MKYKNILVTGGAGFVGSNICIKLKEYYGNIEVIALDNLTRKGSELNVPRLQEFGIKFIKGDVRYKKDLEFPNIDLIIECSAEPSVMAGVTSSPEYLLETNIIGAINCFELARKNKADVVFLSTSRVYPIKIVNELLFTEEETRFSLSNSQAISGASGTGINEKFPLDGVRSLYGTTKLSAELILQEYVENYGIKAVIDRFGLISGPWQMGKSDQGIVVFWLANHVFKRPLSYIGFGGKGKQVRDIINIDDVFDVINLQLNDMHPFNGNIYNIGGGKDNSVSLFELTDLCRKITGKIIDITGLMDQRPGDIRIYISDNAKLNKQTGWKPKKNIDQTLNDIYTWILNNKRILEKVIV